MQVIAKHQRMLGFQRSQAGLPEGNQGGYCLTKVKNHLSRPALPPLDKTRLPKRPLRFFWWEPGGMRFLQLVWVISRICEDGITTCHLH